MCIQVDHKARVRGCLPEEARTRLLVESDVDPIPGIGPEQGLLLSGPVVAEVGRIEGARLTDWLRDKQLPLTSSTWASSYKVSDSDQVRSGQVVILQARTAMDAAVMSFHLSLSPTSSLSLTTALC